MYEAGERNDDDVTVVPGVVDDEDGNSGVYDNSGYTDYSQTDFHNVLFETEFDFREIINCRSFFCSLMETLRVCKPGCKMLKGP